MRVNILKAHSNKTDPLEPGFNYAEAFKKVDYAALKADIHTLLHTQNDIYPLEFGTLGGLAIRVSLAGLKILEDGF